MAISGPIYDEQALTSIYVKLKIIMNRAKYDQRETPVTLILTWQGGGAGVRPDGLYNVIMNQSYWGTIVQTLYLQLDGGLNLRDLKKISGSIFYVGTFFIL